MLKPQLLEPSNISADKSTDISNRLKNPFKSTEIKWRVGPTTKDKTKGVALAYVDPRTVMKRLDDVLGIDNWQCRYPTNGHCELGLRASLFKDNNEGWIWKANFADKSEIEGIKGEASDSFKRAAVLWGISRYLYYLPTVWVNLKPQGKSYALSETPNLPNWALPKDNII